MKALKIILWFAAISGGLSGFINAFLPWHLINEWMIYTETPTLGNEPATIYMYRLGFMAYGMFGVFLGILALNPLKYGAMLPFAASFLFCYASFRLVGGILYQYPIEKYVPDFVICFLLGSLILFLRKRVLKT
jgi:hypothetical protein